MALTITITDAGRAELINADNTGTAPVKIAHVAFTATAFTPSKSQTNLPGEARRLSSIAGEVVAPDTISVTAKDEGSQAYTVRGFGLITDRGTLFAVYGQATPIIEKAGPSTLLLTIDVVLADIDAARLEFGDISFSNPPASTTTPGVVRLSNAVDSSAQNLAATPAAVKSANDNANTRALQSRVISAGTGLSGGGNLSANRTLSLDKATLDSLAAADSAVQPGRAITAGDGLSGGGNLAANRTLSVDGTVVRTSGHQSLSGTKTFTGRIDLKGASSSPDLNIERTNNTYNALMRFITQGGKDVFVGQGDAGRFVVGRNTDLRWSNANCVFEVDTETGDVRWKGTAYGLGGSGTLLNDFNAAPRENGFFSGGGSSASNDGGNAYWPGINLYRNSSDRRIQIGFGGSGNRMSFRGATGSSWGPWLELYHSGNLTPVETSREINSGDGLSGGGDLGANRTLSVDGTVLRTNKANQTVTGSLTAGTAVGPGMRIGGAVSAGNYATMDITTRQSNVTWYIDREYVDVLEWRTHTNGSGFNNQMTLDLTSGNLSLSGIYNGDGSGLTNLNAGRLSSGTVPDARLPNDIVRTARTISTGDGLSGGGNLGGNRTLSVDNSVVRTSRTITAGDGLTGGGNLAGNRTLSLGGYAPTLNSVAEFNDLRDSKFYAVNSGNNTPFRGNGQGLSIARNGSSAAQMHFPTGNAPVQYRTLGSSGWSDVIDFWDNNNLPDPVRRRDFTGSLGEAGWERNDVTGVIHQWGGSRHMNGDTNDTLFFPIRFPNACWKVMVSIRNGVTGDDEVFARVIGFDQNSVTVRADINGPYSSVAGSGRYIDFWAIGN